MYDTLQEVPDVLITALESSTRDIFEGREVNNKMSCYKNHSSDHGQSMCILHLLSIYYPAF